MFLGTGRLDLLQAGIGAARGCGLAEVVGAVVHRQNAKPSPATSPCCSTTGRRPCCFLEGRRMSSSSIAFSLRFKAIQARTRRPTAPVGAEPAPHLYRQAGCAFHSHRAVHLKVISTVNAGRAAEAVADPAGAAASVDMRSPFVRLPSVLSGAGPDDPESEGAAAGFDLQQIATSIGVEQFVPIGGKRAHVERFVAFRIRRRRGRALRRRPGGSPRASAPPGSRPPPAPHSASGSPGPK